MNYHDIKKCDMLNGDGIRVSLWVSGCEHQCRKCQNQQTWSIDSGVPFDNEAEKELFEALRKDYISGITLTGGDPLHKDNLNTIKLLLNKIHLLLPNKTVWLYTGYTLEQCLNDSERSSVVSMCDVVVDGEYVDELRDPTAHWVGSTNQKIWRNYNGDWRDVTNSI